MTTFLAPATFDWICHRLRCPFCGRTPSDDCAVDLQTKLRRAPAQAHLRVSERLDIREDLLTGGYLVTRPEREDTLRVIEAWACPECGKSFLWAVIEVRDGVLVSVTPVLLDEQTLSSVDLITGEVLALFPVERTLDVVALAPIPLRAAIVAAEAERLSEMIV
jgi:hypothetical protein